MNSFHEIQSLAIFCLILSSKFTDNGSKACQLVQSFKNKNLSPDFIGDEFYILKYLNYNLNVPTLYDHITQLQMKGIVFDTENISNKKVNVLYETINKTILNLVENKIMIETPIDVLSYGVVGFCRKLIGLECISSEFKLHHKCDELDMNVLNECINKVGKCFRIKIVNDDLGKVFETSINITCSL